MSERSKDPAYFKEIVELEEKGIKRWEIQKYAREHGLSFSKAVKVMAEEIVKREM
jgi:hypothetical protein